MVYCRECGTEINEDDEFCSDCGANVAKRNNVKPKIEEVDDTTWGLVAAFLPIVGFIGGVVFAIQGKKGAWGIVFFSIICFFGWVFVLWVIFINFM